MHLSFGIIRYFQNPMPLHYFFFWLNIDTHINSVVDRRIHYWINIRQCPSYSKNLVKSFPRYIMPLVNCILSFWHPCSTIELELFTPEACGICFHDAPMGWTYTFPKNHMNPKVFTSHTLLVFYQIIFYHTTSSNARSKWKVMHWRSGSRPWTLRSCPWTRCRSYH